MSNLRTILKQCEMQGFFNIKKRPSRREIVRVGPSGALVQENLRGEWIRSVVLNKDVNIFLTCGDFSDSYNYAKRVSLDKSPFGLAWVSDWKQPEMHVTNESIAFKNYFVEGLLLDCSIFVSPALATQFFHQWQRQRRTWWRKLSPSPGRYFLTDIRQVVDGQHVDIMAEYEWGSQLVETITLSTTASKRLTATQLELEENGKTLQAHVVSSQMCLSTMLMNALTDSYEEPTFQGRNRPLFRLHRKLAPYKVAIATSKKSDDLKDLAMYLSRKLKTNQITCLLLPSGNKHTLESQYHHYDQLGVPYCLVLNENTLKNGLAHLRCRDTTIKEQIHVTKLAQYVENLFRNY